MSWSWNETSLECNAQLEFTLLHTTIGHPVEIFAEHRMFHSNNIPP